MIGKVVLLIGLMACPSASAVTPKAIRESWGKPGVSFDQYRADAIACGRTGYYMDVSNTGEAKAFVSASKQLDGMLGTSSFQVPRSPGEDPMAAIIEFSSEQQQVINGIRPDEKIRTLGMKMQGTIDQCLAERGYRKFRLTAAQTGRLGRMKIGSDERRHYLYELASDPAVLSAQAEPVASSSAAH